MIKNITLTAFAIFACLSIVSCSGDDDSSGGSVSTSNKIEFQGENYSLTDKAYVESYGENMDGSFDWDVSLVSSNLDYLNETGSGNSIYFDLNTSSETGLVSGTYNYAAERQEFTLVDASLALNIEINANGVSGDFYELTQGTVEVDVNGQNLTMSWNLTTANGDAVKGNFTGSMVMVQ